MSGLSGSQAAATLATTLVGARLGISDKLTVNAVLVVILATLIITPAAVQASPPNAWLAREGRRKRSRARCSCRVRVS